MPLLRRLTLLSMFVVAQLGCGSGIAAYFLPVFAGGTPQYAYYHAYGDSITYGATLTNYQTERYPALVAKAKGLTLTDAGISSDQACDVAPRQVFATMDTPSTQAVGVASVLIGVNDSGRRGPGEYEAVFNLCHRAVLAWLAVPQQQKVMATDVSVRRSGTTTIDTTANLTTVTTTAPGSQVVLPFTTAAASPVYLWYRIRDGAAGTFTYAVDGVIQGNLTAATNPVIQTYNGTTNSLAFLRLAPVPAGTHTLTVTQTNSGNDGVGILAIGLPIAHAAGLPIVMAGLLTKSNPACVLCKYFDQDIQANVAALAGDGLEVHLFDAGKYMSGTAADLNDSVHPNTLGHIEVAHALLDSLP